MKMYGYIILILKYDLNIGDDFDSDHRRCGDISNYRHRRPDVRAVCSLDTTKSMFNVKRRRRPDDRPDPKLPGPIFKERKDVLSSVAFWLYRRRKIWSIIFSSIYSRVSNRIKTTTRTTTKNPSTCRCRSNCRRSY